jgi:lipoyl(octanoyl) transferase
VEALSCRLLPWEVADGPTNMAADEVLVRTAAERGIASLRYYGWSPATLSLGYFQPVRACHDHPRLAALPFVRRPSGGSALVHDHEVTYALAIPPGREWHAGPWMPRMHALIACALDRLDLVGRVSCVNADETRQDGGTLCFQKWTAGDLLCQGFKIVGSAQRKYRGALLQHGSILLRRSEHAPALPGLEDLTGVTLPTDRLGVEISCALALATGWQLVFAEWSAEELVAIPGLVREKYGTLAWNERR